MVAASKKGSAAAGRAHACWMLCCRERAGSSQHAAAQQRAQQLAQQCAQQRRAPVAPSVVLPKNAPALNRGSATPAARPLAVNDEVNALLLSLRAVPPAPPLAASAPMPLVAIIHAFLACL